MNAAGTNTAQSTRAMAISAAPDLVHAAPGGVAGGETGLDAALDILHHDDCVIDDDADREHQTEQRQMCSAKSRTSP